MLRFARNDRKFGFCKGILLKLKPVLPDSILQRPQGDPQLLSGPLPISPGLG